VCVCNALIASNSVQSIRSSPNLERRLPHKWRTIPTIYSQNGFMQCVCAATDFRGNDIFSFVSASGHNFSPIFIKFGTRIAEVIFKAEFVCDRKRKYFSRMRNSQIFVLLRHFQYFTSKTSFFIQSSPYLGLGTSLVT